MTQEIGPKASKRDFVPQLLLVVGILWLIGLGAVAIYGGMQLVDHYFTKEEPSLFVAEPLVDIDFRQQDPLFLKRFFAEHNCYPAYNGEAQCYTKDNVYLDPDRGLVLVAKYEGQDENGEPFITSGRVDTRQFFHPTCGLYQIDVSFPAGTGVFGAVWLREPDWLQVDDALVNPALNIVEFQGGLPDRVTFNLHTADALLNPESESVSYAARVPEINSGVHTYAIEWTDTYISYFVDGQEYYTINKDQTQGWIYGPTDLIINLAMGGNWAETIASREGLETTYKGIELTQVGQEWEMVVQGLRYYPLVGNSCSQ